MYIYIYIIFINIKYTAKLMLTYSVGSFIEARNILVKLCNKRKCLHNINRKTIK